ncbi:MAG: FAD binding domain-containing protein [Verrucomicrobiota bacterium]
MNSAAPRTLEEALALRAACPEAVPVAGGTDLMVEVNAGRRRIAALLDLSRVEELQGWERRNGTVFVGAGMTFARIARVLGEFQPLVQAARSVGSPPIRNRATIGGNLATASPAGDSLPVLAAYEANVLLAAAAGRRRLPLAEFLTGPKQTALAPDELIVGVEWTPVEGEGRFLKVGIRNAMVIAVASACLQLDEREHHVRIALGSVAPTVLRARVAEAFADDALDWDQPERALEDFGRLAAAETQPIDDLRGSAAYRRHAVEVLARRTLVAALEAR